MQWVKETRENIHSLLERCNVPYKVIPFDEKLYQECIDDGSRRGYPMDNVRMRSYLRAVGVVYAATAGRHIPHRPTQIWIALCVALFLLVDDIPEKHLQELPSMYQFNDRFVKNELQGNCFLESFADVLRRTSDLYHPIAAQLITTSLLNFVTASLLEHETKVMKISTAAVDYPTYQRIMSGAPEAFSFMAFWKEVPLNSYIQAIPDIMVIINNGNDILSFYKEELIGESTNQISTLAARTQKSKLEALAELTEACVGAYKRLNKILEESPIACEAFKSFKAGFMYFHTSSPRYRLSELFVGLGDPATVDT